jgi:hypothetical protein
MKMNTLSESVVKMKSTRANSSHSSIRILHLN